MLRWAKELSASLQETPETEKEAEKTEAEQQEKEAEIPEADLTETGQGEAQRGREEQEEDCEVSDCQRQAGQSRPTGRWRDQRGGGGRSPEAESAGRVVSPIPKSFFESFESLPPTLENCAIRVPETMQERLLFGIMF
jgi:hypothetical protein